MDSAAELEAARASSAGWRWRPLSPRTPTAAAAGPAQIRRPPLWPRVEEAGRAAAPRVGEDASHMQANSVKSFSFILLAI